MQGIVFIVALLVADPTAAEQKCIDQGRAKLAAWREAQATNNEAKTKAMQADVEAATNGTINEKQRVPFTKKDGKYVFHNQGYKDKHIKQLQSDLECFILNIPHQRNAPKLNWSSFKKGDIGYLLCGAIQDDGSRVGLLSQLDPGPKGHAMAKVDFTPKGESKSFQMLIVVVGDPSDEKLRAALERDAFVVAGVVKYQGKSLPRLIALE